jgi:hypothetical protein
MKRGPATWTVVGRDAQVDLCPSNGGMVVSIGRMSFWLERREVEDLVETLEQALLVWMREGTTKDGDSPAGEAVRALRRAHAS